MNTYEIMFLFDPTFGVNWEAVQGEIKRLMDRAHAEVIITRRLEERRLAFEIKGRKRGLYVLTYFNAPGGSISSLERDARLTESILRVLILRADGISEERMRAVTLGGIAQEPRPERSDDSGPRPARPETADDEPALVGTPTHSDDTET